MSAGNKTLALLTLIACCLTAHTRAGTIALGNNSTPLNISIIKLDTPGMTPVYHAIASVGASRFDFIAPEDFRIRNEAAAGRLSFIKSDGSCTLTFRFVTSEKNNWMPDLPTCREFALAQHPGATILQESTANVCGKACPAFDLRWVAGGGFVNRTRIVLAPTAAGIAEFNFTAPPPVFTAFQEQFHRFLDSFGPVKPDFKPEPLVPTN
jgi:hypothetical protein